MKIDERIKRKICVHLAEEAGNEKAQKLKFWRSVEEYYEKKLKKLILKCSKKKKKMNPMDYKFDVQVCMKQLSELDKSYYTDQMILYAENRKKLQKTSNSDNTSLKHLIKENE